MIFLRQGGGMLYKIGRFFQLLGLIITPVGIGGNLARPEEVGIKASLAIAGVGVLIFFIGWLFQQRARPG